MYITPVFAARFEKHNNQETDPRAKKKKFSDFLLLFSTPIFYVRIFISSPASILKKWALYNSTRRRCIQARKQKEKIINRLQEIV